MTPQSRGIHYLHIPNVRQSVSKSPTSAQKFAKKQKKRDSWGIRSAGIKRADAGTQPPRPPPTNTRVCENRAIQAEVGNLLPLLAPRAVHVLLMFFWKMRSSKMRIASNRDQATPKKNRMTPRFIFQFHCTKQKFRAETWSERPQPIAISPFF